MLVIETEGKSLVRQLSLRSTAGAPGSQVAEPQGVASPSLGAAASGWG